tara:strand:- start:67 stop:453 length:387 start_codon:yes stop_codon:yes gene_type:complete
MAKGMTKQLRDLLKKEGYKIPAKKKVRKGKGGKRGRKAYTKSQLDKMGKVRKRYKNKKGTYIANKPTGKSRGRRAKPAPKTRVYSGKRFRLSGNKGGHKTKRLALKAAPKMHRIEQYSGRFYVYTRGR